MKPRHETRTGRTLPYIFYGLNIVSWFVLMLFAPLAWIIIIRMKKVRNWKKLIVSFVAILPLMLTSIIMSLILNGVISLFGLQ